MPYREYSKNQDIYKYIGPDGKEYFLNFTGDGLGNASRHPYLDHVYTGPVGIGYTVDDFGEQGQKKHLAIAVKLFMEKGEDPTKEEFYAALNEAGIKSTGRSKEAWDNIKSDLEKFKKNNNIDPATFKKEVEEAKSKQQGLDSYDPRANYYDLIIDSNSPGANEYRSAMESSIDRQQAEVDKTIAAAELDAYRMLGNQQLQLERQIADQRMRSLRSGTTSAQLAAMELQNMFAGQTAAAGIASQVMQQRIGNAQQFAQQRGAIEPGLYDMINQNKTTLANVEAQRFAAQKGLEGYSTYHQALMMGRLKQTDPEAYYSYYDLIKQQ